jgi:hypothetical protein
MEFRKAVSGSRYWSLAIVLGLVTISGCENTAAPVPAEEEQARQTLDRVLGLWKEGQTVESVKKGSPSIQVSDPNWEHGDLLKKYEVTGPGKPSGAERAYTVVLWLADAKGKERRSEVVYKVGTHPIFTVFRSLF